MNFREIEESNQFIKEQTRIERYLKRVIERYFDIENTLSQSSVEAIIVESITRLKRELLEEKGYIFTFNEKTGHINLTIQDFNGEPAFDKNTAFNKDFDIAPDDATNYEGKPDTICEGNDIRLINTRNPLPHVHTVSEIPTLEEKLKELDIYGLNKYHLHRNLTILDMLTYSGKMVQFDLILIEELLKSVTYIYEHLDFKKAEIKSYHDKNLEKLDMLFPVLKSQLEEATVVATEAVNWLTKAKDYISKNTDIFKNDQLRLLYNYLNKEEYNVLLEYMKTTYKTKESITPLTISPSVEFNPVLINTVPIATTFEGDGLREIYDNGVQLGSTNWEFDSTTGAFVYKTNDSYSMFASVQEFTSYTHRVRVISTNDDDDMIGAIIAYDENTNNHISVRVSGGNVCGNSSHHLGNPGISFYYGNGANSGTRIGQYNILDSNVASQGWSGNIPNGVMLLIRKEKNIVKVWVEYNTVGTNFNVVNTDTGVQDIVPTSQPYMQLDLSSYPEFKDKKARYGYCVESQALSTYADIWFAGFEEGTMEIYDTKVQYHAEQDYITPLTNTNEKFGQIKHYIQYTHNGQTYEEKLPFVHTMENGQQLYIKAIDTIEQDKIKTNIQMDLITRLPFEMTGSSFFTPTKAIGVVNVQRTIEDTKTYLSKYHCHLPIIDNVQKENFIKDKLVDGMKYFIQGYQQGANTIDENGNPLPYTQWANNYPNTSDEDKVPIYIDSSIKRKWRTIYYWAIDKACCVCEYDIQDFNTYFQSLKVHDIIFVQKGE